MITYREYWAYCMQFAKALVKLDVAAFKITNILGFNSVSLSRDICGDFIGLSGIMQCTRVGLTESVVERKSNIQLRTTVSAIVVLVHSTRLLAFSNHHLVYLLLARMVHR